MARNGSAASLAAARDRWEGQNIVPRSEDAVFRQLIVSEVAVSLKKNAMIERYPFLFGTQDKASIDAYVKTMTKISNNLPDQ